MQSVFPHEVKARYLNEWRYARRFSEEPTARLPYLALARDKLSAQRGREATPWVPLTNPIAKRQIKS
jgi:hypothetical protein